MEVHAHTHTPRKKWTHYFWEFLMLFLAVFCGFTAENIREHKIEKQRSNQYIRSFYDDLKKDTFLLSAIITVDNEKLIALAGIFKCYDSISQNWRSTSCLIPIEKYSRSNNTVAFSTGTLQQLKNAGGYRLLPKEDRDSIMAYDSRIENYKNYESTIFQEGQDIVRNTFSSLVNFNARKFLQRNVAGPDSSATEVSLLFADNKELLNKYFNDLFRYKIVIEGQRRILNQILERALAIIAYLKNKYHFK